MRPAPMVVLGISRSAASRISPNIKGDRTMLNSFMAIARNCEANVVSESYSPVHCQREYARVSEARRMSFEEAHNSAWHQKSGFIIGGRTQHSQHRASVCVDDFSLVLLRVCGTPCVHHLVALARVVVRTRTDHLPALCTCHMSRRQPPIYLTVRTHFMHALLFIKPHAPYPPICRRTVSLECRSRGE